MKCPRCQNNVIQRADDGIQLRFRVMEKSLRRADDGTFRANCYWCKAEVILPLSLDSSEEKFLLEAEST